MAPYREWALQNPHDQASHYVLLAINVLLFRTPDVYVTELRSLRDNFTLEDWSKFIEKVDGSIRDSNLLVTVLLSTSMGFLSWSNYGKTGGINSPTVAQIVTYISIIFGGGSIVTGLAIIKRYRVKVANGSSLATVVPDILSRRLGPEKLAIMCSLPYVLFVWGLVAFLAAFCIILYDGTGIQVRIPVTVALFLIVASLWFCLCVTAGPPDKIKQLRADNVASVSGA